ncbi:MAG: hypothetical protein ACRDNL_08500 [Spirillospora sp.]
MTDQDLLFDLDLRVVPDENRTEHAWGSVHTTYITEIGCTMSVGVC